MPNIQETLQAKLKDAEVLSTRIKQLNQGSEEQFLPTRLACLKAEINGTEAGTLDLWAKYREGEWHLPKFGRPGPSDEPPRMSLKDFLF